MKTVIIDYGAGNLRSVYKAFLEVSGNNEIVISSDEKEVLNADRIVLPGVGAFNDCMNSLKSLNGMIDALKDSVIEKSKPFLGICVGMQLLANKGYEYGETEGLKIIKGNIKKITARGVKIPHMGWNELHLTKEHFCFNGIKNGVDNVYFVHSYHLTDFIGDEVIAFTDYGNESIVAGVLKNNILGLQFHPEKSQKVGLKIIENFLNWRP